MAALTLGSDERSKLCEQSLLVRSKVLPARTWSRRWKRAGSMPHLFGRILKPSHGSSFAEKWTYCQAAFLVSHSQPQGEEPQMMTPATFGPTSSEDSESWDGLPLFSSRMLKASSPQSSRVTDGPTLSGRPFCFMCSASWKGWATKQRRAYSQRVKSARPTSASECLLWGCAPISATQGALLFQRCLGTQSKADAPPTQRQEAQSSMLGSPPESQWATPTTRDHKGVQSYDRSHLARGYGDQLPDQTAQYPQWATPTTRDYKGYYPRHSQESPLYRTRNLLPDQAHSNTYTGKLNPRWVETLMGLPVGWTMPSWPRPWTIERMSSGCLGMELCQPPQSEPLEPYGES
jgi:hypothetical protein